MRRSPALIVVLALATAVTVTGQEAPDETAVPFNGFEPFWRLAETQPAPWAERGSDETVSVAITTDPDVGVVSDEVFCRLVASGLFPDEAPSQLQLARCAGALNERYAGQMWLPFASWGALHSPSCDAWWVTRCASSASRRRRRCCRITCRRRGSVAAWSCPFTASP